MTCVTNQEVPDYFDAVMETLMESQLARTTSRYFHAGSKLYDHHFLSKWDVHRLLSEIALAHQEMVLSVGYLKQDDLHIRTLDVLSRMKQALTTVEEEATQGSVSGAREAFAALTALIQLFNSIYICHIEILDEFWEILEIWT